MTFLAGGSKTPHVITNLTKFVSSDNLIISTEEVRSERLHSDIFSQIKGGVNLEYWHIRVINFYLYEIWLYCHDALTGDRIHIDKLSSDRYTRIRADYVKIAHEAYQRHADLEDHGTHYVLTLTPLARRKWSFDLVQAKNVWIEIDHTAFKLKKDYLVHLIRTHHAEKGQKVKTKTNAKGKLMIKVIDAAPRSLVTRLKERLKNMGVGDDFLISELGPDVEISSLRTTISTHKLPLSFRHDRLVMIDKNIDRRKLTKRAFLEDKINQLETGECFDLKDIDNINIDIQYARTVISNNRLPAQTKGSLIIRL